MRHATLSGYWVLIQVSLGYSHLRDRFLTCYAPVRHSPIGTEVPGSFDLHVLSTPPAFVLSQDQTLRQDLIRLAEAYLTRSKSPYRTSTGWKYPLARQLAGIDAVSSSGKPVNDTANVCVTIMSDLTRLCGSISGCHSNSRSPALAFIVLCSVVKERCGR